MLAYYPVALAYVYESVVACRITSLSVFDIALVLDVPVTGSPDRLQLELQGQKERARACKIGQADVRRIDDAPLTVRGEVVTHGISL